MLVFQWHESTEHGHTTESKGRLSIERLDLHRHFVLSELRVK